MKDAEIEKFASEITEDHWEELQRARSACCEFLEKEHRSIGFLFNSVSILALVLRNAIEEKLKEETTIEKPLPLPELLTHLGEYCEVLDEILNDRKPDKTVH